MRNKIYNHLKSMFPELKKVKKKSLHLEIKMEIERVLVVNIIISFTSTSCFSVISTLSRTVFRSGAAPAESLDVSIFERLSLTREEALSK